MKPPAIDLSSLVAFKTAAEEAFSALNKTDAVTPLCTPANLDRAAILDAARQAVTVDRAATHGAAENTFGRIAALWSPLLGIDLTPAQVCLMLAQLKVARAWGNPAHVDNWVDLAGYAACGGELAGGAGDA